MTYESSGEFPYDGSLDVNFDEFLDVDTYFEDLEAEISEPCPEAPDLTDLHICNSDHGSSSLFTSESSPFPEDVTLSHSDSPNDTPWTQHSLSSDIAVGFTSVYPDLVPDSQVTLPTAESSMDVQSRSVGCSFSSYIASMTFPTASHTSVISSSMSPMMSQNPLIQKQLDSSNSQSIPRPRKSRKRKNPEDLA